MYVFKIFNFLKNGKKIIYKKGIEKKPDKPVIYKKLKNYIIKKYQILIKINELTFASLLHQ